MTDATTTSSGAPAGGGASRDKKFYAGHRDGKRPLARDPLKGARDRYDVVVIGSGLGGYSPTNSPSADSSTSTRWRARCAMHARYASLPPFD